jgi:hypothetical protein
MAIQEDLEAILKKHSDRFNYEQAERVLGLIGYTEQNPNKRTPYNRLLKEYNDWVLYYNLHPKLKGKSFGELRRDKDGRSFLKALKRRGFHYEPADKRDAAIYFAIFFKLYFKLDRDPNDPIIMPAGYKTLRKVSVMDAIRKNKYR